MTDGFCSSSRPGHGKSSEPVFGRPIGWNGSPSTGTVNHLSIAKTRCRNVCTNDHSPFTDSCNVSSGSARACLTVLAHSSSNAVHAARIPSGSAGRSIARSGYHVSRSLTYAVTSTPLMTTLSTNASMSTLTSHAWLIRASVRLTSRKVAPLRSAPQKTAPARSPSNSSGMFCSSRAFIQPAAPPFCTRLTTGAPPGCWSRQTLTRCSGLEEELLFLGAEQEAQLIEEYRVVVKQRVGINDLERRVARQRHQLAVTPQ